ncbi:MAG: hypothetical protein K0S55_2016, partial [Clostridia bacterium]|nr:hypothetical protein [Clostridia bacterium]
CSGEKRDFSDLKVRLIPFIFVINKVYSPFLGKFINILLNSLPNRYCY